MVKNPPSNAGDTGSIPVWGTKIPHAAGQLSPHTATTEPMLWSLHDTTREPVRHNEDPTCHSQDPTPPNK